MTLKMPDKVAPWSTATPMENDGRQGPESATVKSSLGSSSGTAATKRLPEILDDGRPEARLRKSKALLRNLYDATGIMMGIIEVIDGDILHIAANPAAAKLFGKTPRTLRNQRSS